MWSMRSWQCPLCRSASAGSRAACGRYIRCGTGRGAAVRARRCGRTARTCRETSSAPRRSRRRRRLRTCACRRSATMARRCRPARARRRAWRRPASKAEALGLHRAARARPPMPCMPWLPCRSRQRHASSCELGEVGAEAARGRGQAQLGVDQAVEIVGPLPRDRFGLAQHDGDAGQDGAFVRRRGRAPAMRAFRSS